MAQIKTLDVMNDKWIQIWGRERVQLGGSLQISMKIKKMMEIIRKKV